MRSMKILAVIAIGISFIGLAGCGVSKDKYESLLSEKIVLEEKVNILMQAKDAVKKEYDIVLKEKMELATKLEIVTNEKAALKGEYDKILDEKVTVKAAYDTLLAESNKQ